MINTKTKGELGIRIEYDVEHDLFHPQNVYSDEYITPTFVEYVQKLEKENAELKAKIYGGGYKAVIAKKDADLFLLNKTNLEQRSQLRQFNNAKEIIKGLLQYRDRMLFENKDYEKLIAEAEQFLSEVKKWNQ